MSYFLFELKTLGWSFGQKSEVTNLFYKLWEAKCQDSPCKLHLFQNQNTQNETIRNCVHQQELSWQKPLDLELQSLPHQENLTKIREIDRNILEEHNEKRWLD